MNKKYCAITFPSVSFAIQFEKIIKENNIEIKLIPVPRSISSSCGLCGRFDFDKKDLIINICKENNLIYDNVYDIWLIYFLIIYNLIGGTNV